MTLYELLKVRFREAGHRLYVVGGHVRDRMLGISPSGEIDLSTDAVPDRVRTLLEQADCAVLEMGIAFGTLTARHRRTEEMAEITTFRTGERYHPGSRHPKVTFGTRLEDDLLRRDFTVNAMALDEEDRLIDPFRGMDDLRAGRLRTPGDAMVSFREDPLRILRAFRFMAVLDFSLEEKTEAAIRQRAGDLSLVASERKLKEMNLLLAAPGGRLPRVLEAMLETGVLPVLLPELTGLAGLRDSPHGRHHALDPWRHTLEVVRHAPADPLLRWAALFHDAGKASTRFTDPEGEPHFHGHEKAGADLARRAAENMRFSRAWRRSLVFLVQNHMRPVLYHDGWGDGAVRRLAASAGEDLDRLLLLAGADIRSGATEAVPDGLKRLDHLKERLAGIAEMPRLLRKGTGEVLRDRLGLEGEALGAAVRRLEEAVLAGDLPGEPDPWECVRFLETSGPEPPPGP